MGGRSVVLLSGTGGERGVPQGMFSFLPFPPFFLLAKFPPLSF